MHSKNVRLTLLALALLGFLVGCGGDGSGVVVGGDYPIAYVDRSVAAAGEAADGVVFVPGGDLYLRELSSPNAAARNITREYTQGRGDVAGPEASYDGRRLVFSMRGPNDPTWNIWEYSLDSGTLRRVIPDNETANAGDDLDPHYLPDGRIVFTSSRQAGTRAQLEQAGIEPYSYRDGYGREAALVLHVMNADGSGIEQISFNQSHDRNPTVRMNGELMYARWEHMGNRNQQPIFTMRPDGRQLDVLYGAFSPGDSFLHPRELPDGRIISTVLPLAGVRNGGALVIADVVGHTDHQRRLDGTAGTGQYQPTLYELPLGRVPSPKGRYTTPYPLWDRSGRVLVAWSPQQRGGTASSLLPGETEPRYGIYMLNLNDRSLRPIAFAETGRVLTDPVALMPRPRPAIIAPATPPGERIPVEPRPFPCPDGTWRESCDGIPEPDPEPVCPDGFRPRPFPPNECEPEPEPDPEPTCPDGYRPRPFPTPPDQCEPEPKPDPVCPEGYRPRPFPPPTPTPPPPDECEPDPGPGPGPGPDPDPDPDPDPGPGPGPGPSPDSRAILNIRSVYDTDFLDSMGDSVLVAGEQIPRSADGRPDLARLRDASQTSAAERPARFLRVSRAVPLPPGLALDTVSGTAFKMQQLLGYVPIEPDGSVRVAVPADTPLSLAVVDAYGRAFQTHTSWLQARPGEERRCHGCHSGHRSEQPLNVGSLLGGPFEGAVAALSAQPGETMAETRTRLNPAALQLQLNPVARDVWTDPVVAGRGRDPELSLPPSPAGVRPGDSIDYVRHIQPIWDANCVSCHTAGNLDLSATPGPAGRLRSYDSLVLGRPIADSATQRDGRVVIERAPPLVNVGGSANSSRSSHLVEVLFAEELLAPQALSGVPDHSGYISSAELRLITEWIDLGAAYRNALSPELSVAPLDREQFSAEVHPLLRSRCLSCHLPHATSGDLDAPNHRNPNYAPNRFALSGNAETDFGAAAAMV
ncbi:MAG TPA: hypothetical protein VFY81_02700, partial [Gammaproteobacteria bacterium]|nr:hypothetical protein [Gammaproteobacteria bacterium]